jgi:hypothetical protein
MEQLRTLCKEAEHRLAGLCADFDRMDRELAALRLAMEQRKNDILAARGVVAGIKLAMGEAADADSVPASMLTLKLSDRSETTGLEDGPALQS